jgi:hypothetical protein
MISIVAMIVIVIKIYVIFMATSHDFSLINVTSHISPVPPSTPFPLITPSLFHLVSHRARYSFDMCARLMRTPVTRIRY